MKTLSDMSNRELIDAAIASLKAESPLPKNYMDEAVVALVNMGFTRQEIAKALGRIEGADSLDFGVLLRNTLQLLG